MPCPNARLECTLSARLVTAAAGSNPQVSGVGASRTWGSFLVGSVHAICTNDGRGPAFRSRYLGLVHAPRWFSIRRFRGFTCRLAGALPGRVLSAICAGARRGPRSPQRRPVAWRDGPPSPANGASVSPRWEHHGNTLRHRACHHRQSRNVLVQVSKLRTRLHPWFAKCSRTRSLRLAPPGSVSTSGPSAGCARRGQRRECRCNLLRTMPAPSERRHRSAGQRGISTCALAIAVLFIPSQASAQRGPDVNAPLPVTVGNRSIPGTPVAFTLGVLGGPKYFFGAKQ
jgi:hypothetical protein